MSAVDKRGGTQSLMPVAWGVGGRQTDRPTDKQKESERERESEREAESSKLGLALRLTVRLWQTLEGLLHLSRAESIPRLLVLIVVVSDAAVVKARGIAVHKKPADHKAMPSRFEGKLSQMLHDAFGD